MRAPHRLQVRMVGSRRIGSPCDCAILRSSAASLALVSAMAAASGSSRPGAHLNSAQPGTSGGVSLKLVVPFVVGSSTVNVTALTHL